MKIAVVGSGYVGLVAGACFAESGNDVICVDKDEAKIERLRSGEVPIYEPGLSDLLLRNSKNKRITYTTSLKDAVEESSIIFIAVGTPQDEDGSADLSHVLAVARGIGQAMNGPKVVVDKSTVPVGTAALVEKTIRAETKHQVEVVSNPEFLKEGAALDDFLKPDRVVIGTSSDHARQVMAELYAPFVRTNNPILFMDQASAEMTKYAANAMLAARVSFMNEISNLCERSGADVDHVRVGIGTDSRIGMGFLFPGAGYGGSCFPKDVQALVKTGKDFGLDLKIATATEAVNFEQKKVLATKVIKHFGEAGLKNRVIGIWGLAFKPRTDDVREAPAKVVCEMLLAAGARLQAYDPEANETFRQLIGDQPEITYCKETYEAVEGADALVICTEWNEFRNPDFERIRGLLKQPVIFDGRNIYNAADMGRQGFTYHSIGRPVERGAK